MPVQQIPNTYNYGGDSGTYGDGGGITYIESVCLQTLPATGFAITKGQVVAFGPATLSFASCVPTGTTSPIWTLSTGFSGVMVGQAVSGTHVSTGATVVAYSGGTAVTLSSDPTATGNETLTFTGLGKVSPGEIAAEGVIVATAAVVEICGVAMDNADYGQTCKVATAGALLQSVTNSGGVTVGDTLTATTAGEVVTVTLTEVGTSGVYVTQAGTILGYALETVATGLITPILLKLA